MPTNAFRAVARLEDLHDGAATPLAIDGTTVLLCKVGDRVFAIAGTCSHADQDLTHGPVCNGWIACPAHGARFDLATGEPLNPPATESLTTYEVRILNGIVEIRS